MHVHMYSIHVYMHCNSLDFAERCSSGLGHTQHYVRDATCLLRALCIGNEVSEVLPESP